MATITTPAKGFTGSVVGVDFKDGVGETTDAAALEYFERQGYTIEDVEPAFPKGKPSDKWKVDQLKAYAEANTINLAEAKTKDEILALLAEVDATDGTAAKTGDTGANGTPVEDTPAK